MTERIVWGPDPRTPDFAAVSARMTIADPRALPSTLQRLAEAVSAPVAALRADRVLCVEHLVMARDHAARALSGGRARTRDLSTEFILYAAADRQIHRAIDAVGLPVADDVAVVLVALARDTGSRLAAAARADVFRDVAPWPFSGAPSPDAHTATAWWSARLGVPADASLRRLEDALLSAMALLAVAKA